MQAGQAAEQQFDLPPGLLLAIGRVESGRYDPRLGKVVPWPWAIDAAGQGESFDSSAAAVQATRALQAAGQHNIDVGCFQISLLHHPNAFPDLAQAFDPQANAQYAARFLVSLHERLGNWQDAVAAYHSATPDLGQPYLQRVMATWTGTTAASPSPGLSIIAASYTPLPGIHVWVPYATGRAPAIIKLPTPVSPSMPRVITPGR